MSRIRLFIIFIYTEWSKSYVTEKQPNISVTNRAKRKKSIYDEKNIVGHM